LKAPLASPTFTGTTTVTNIALSGNIVANSATITSSELSMLDGISTSSTIQSQLNALASASANVNQPLNYYLIPHGPTTLAANGFAKTFVCDVTDNNCNFTFPALDASHDGMRFVIKVIALTGTNVLFLTFSGSSRLFKNSFTGSTGETLAIWATYEIVCYDGGYYVV